MKFKIFILFFPFLIFTMTPEQRFLNKKLIQAVKQSHIHQIKSLLRRGADVNAIDKYGKTALIISSENGDFTIVTFLIKQGANVNAIDFKLKTALLYAKNHYEIINILLKAGACFTPSNPILKLTTQEKRFKMIELILKHINHMLDQVNDSETYHRWDQYILDSLNEITSDRYLNYSIETINAFRMLLHDADKLPLSTKKLESLIAKALKHRYFGEEAFRKSVKHLRTHAF